MRRNFTGFLGALSLVGVVGAAACSSDDSGGGDSGDKPYEPAGNGLPMGESEACKAITDAEDDKRTALSCGPVTRPPCPGYLAKSNPACSQYDQGTVQACVAYIAGHASCDALSKKKCVVKVIAGSAPNGCPAVDAGPDAPEDSGQDVTVDSDVDAGSDAGDDAPGEAASDAPGDAPADSATDAASD